MCSPPRPSYSVASSPLVVPAVASAVAGVEAEPPEVLERRSLSAGFELAAPSDLESSDSKRRQCSATPSG